jgi:hypothetical protein
MGWKRKEFTRQKGNSREMGKQTFEFGCIFFLYKCHAIGLIVSEPPNEEDRDELIIRRNVRAARLNIS